MSETPTKEFHAFIRAWAAERGGRPKVLEVGGGSKSYVGLSGAEFTSLEPTPDTLARSRYADHHLLGDAQTFDYGANRFDVVVFWNVLEHLAQPDRALARAAGALLPGGLIVVRGPELNSLKALVTRWTPHRFHVFCYRRLFGLPNAGQKGHAPFPVEHGSAASREAIEALLQNLGLQARFRQSYVGDQLLILARRFAWLHAGYRLASGALRLGSRGRLGRAESDFVAAYQA